MALASGPRGRVALLVDYENLYYGLKGRPGTVTHGRLIKALDRVAAGYGPVVIRRAYAHWPTVNAYTIGSGEGDAQGTLYSNNFEPKYTGKDKNSTDVVMSNDAQELAHLHDLDWVIIVSGDRDFRDAVGRLRQAGKRVAVWAAREAASGAIKAVADDFQTVEAVLSEADRLRDGHAPRIPPLRSTGPAPKPQPRTTTLSASKLKAYRQCPLRYKLTYIDHVPEPPSLPMYMGNCVHDALALLHRLPPEGRSLEAAERFFRGAWRRRRLAASQEEQRDYGLKGLACLEGYVRHGDLKATPLIIEETFSRTVEAGLEFVGKLDRVDHTPQGLVVIDYKTGKPPARQPGLDDEFQLALYQWLVPEMYGPVTEVVVLHLPDCLRYTYTIGAEDVGRALDTVRRAAAEIRADREFRPKLGHLCPWCNRLDACALRDQVPPKPAGVMEEELPF